jgi:hypothetical protein
MTVSITLSLAGSSTGPTFNLYASPDGITFTTIVLGVNKTALEEGYTATVPNGTTRIKVTSVGACTDSYVAIIGVVPTTTTTTTVVLATTTTTTATPLTTTTTTAIPLTTSTTTAAPLPDFCVNWTAANEGNIKMSTEGYIDFTEVLGPGRTLQPGPLSVGTITGYIISGVGTFTCSIPMTIVPSTNRATWNTDALPVVTDKVLTSLIYYVEAMFSDNSDYFIPNVNYSGQTNAIVLAGQITSSYNNCPITTTTSSTSTTTTTSAPLEPGITLSVSNDSAAQACAFYGDPGSEVYYYADDIWYIATGLYQNPAMTILAPANFWYCNGVYARLWDGSSFVGNPVTC